MVQVLGTILLLYQGREANLQLHLLLNTVPNPDQLISPTKESRQLCSPSYSLTWVGNQASSPIQTFSASGTPPSPVLRAQIVALLPLTKDFNSRPHLLKEITNRQTQKPKQN